MTILQDKGLHSHTLFQRKIWPLLLDFPPDKAPLYHARKDMDNYQLLQKEKEVEIHQIFLLVKFSYFLEKSQAKVKLFRCKNYYFFIHHFPYISHGYGHLDKIDICARD